MDIKIPTVGESVVEALVAKWHKQSGDHVTKDDLLCELETDKITLDLQADGTGILKMLVPEGETVKIGTIIGTIDEEAVPANASGTLPAEATAAPPASPAVRKMAAEQGVDLATINGSGRGKRVTVEDLQKAGNREKAEVSREKTETEKPLAVHSEEATPYTVTRATPADDRNRRVPMTPIRKRIAERLLAARQQTAMLTTFNEADMSRIIELRGRHKEQMRQRHGVSLGFMSFFVKACCEALREFPAVNATIDGSDIIYHNYYDIGIAIGGKKGLVVPIVRGADRLHFWEVEQQIVELVAKVEANQLVIADLEGGTFTISNGGVYGSLLSTPIINPPQSGVLGMHAIQERPVVRDGQIVSRPMMYLALSYDHRLIDGHEAVEFLKKVKELVEEPEELLLEG